MMTRADAVKILDEAERRMAEGARAVREYDAMCTPGDVVNEGGSRTAVSDEVWLAMRAMGRGLDRAEDAQKIPLEGFGDSQSMTTSKGDVANWLEKFSDRQYDQNRDWLRVAAQLIRSKWEERLDEQALRVGNEATAEPLRRSFVMKTNGMDEGVDALAMMLEILTPLSDINRLAAVSYVVERLLIPVKSSMGGSR